MFVLLEHFSVFKYFTGSLDQLRLKRFNLKHKTLCLIGGNHIMIICAVESTWLAERSSLVFTNVIYLDVGQASKNINIGIKHVCA